MRSSTLRNFIYLLHSFRFVFFFFGNGTAFSPEHNIKHHAFSCCCRTLSALHTSRHSISWLCVFFIHCHLLKSFSSNGISRSLKYNLINRSCLISGWSLPFNHFECLKIGSTITWINHFLKVRTTCARAQQTIYLGFKFCSVAHRNLNGKPYLPKMLELFSAKRRGGKKEGFLGERGDPGGGGLERDLHQEVMHIK